MDNREIVSAADGVTADQIDNTFTACREKGHTKAFAGNFISVGHGLGVKVRARKTAR